MMIVCVRERVCEWERACVVLWILCQHIMSGAGWGFQKCRHKHILFGLCIKHWSRPSACINQESECKRWKGAEREASRGRARARVREGLDGKKRRRCGRKLVEYWLVQMLLNMQRGRTDEPRETRLAFSVSGEKREKGLRKVRRCMRITVCAGWLWVCVCSSGRRDGEEV